MGNDQGKVEFINFLAIYNMFQVRSIVILGSLASIMTSKTRKFLQRSYKIMYNYTEKIQIQN